MNENFFRNWPVVGVADHILMYPRNNYVHQQLQQILYFHKKAKIFWDTTEDILQINIYKFYSRYVYIILLQWNSYQRSVSVYTAFLMDRMKISLKAVL